MQLLIMGLIAGIAVGGISGLVGIGGGTLTIPLLLYVFRIDMHSAAGTSLAIIIPTALVGVATHFSRGTVDWRLALLIAVGSIVGSYLGSNFAYALSATTLKKIFAMILLIVSLSILLDAYGIGLSRLGKQQASATPEVAATKES